MGYVMFGRPCLVREISYLLSFPLNEISTINELMANVEMQMACLAISDKRIGFTGIDCYGALLLLYEIGNITRFSNPKKLVSWVGLDPSLYQSGNTRWTGRITRQGTGVLDGS